MRAVCRAPGGRTSTIWAMASIASLAFATSQASAQAAQLFPVKSSAVAIVVAAAFMLPALLAGALSVTRRAMRSPGVLGLGLLAAAAAAVLYARPDLLAAVMRI